MYLKFKKNYFSQNGEDGIIEKIIEQLDLNQKIFVCEFGAGNGISLSNTFNLVTKHNAVSLMIENNRKLYEELLKTSDQNKNIIPVNRSVEATGNNSLNNILKENNFPRDFDLLSIDIDSNDLEVWENLDNYEPKIVIIEINSYIAPHILHRHNPESGLRGNSFKSTLEVSQKKGYCLIAHTGNLIFLRNDLIKKIEFKEDLIKNPEKLFIYKWIYRKKFNNFLIKIMKFFIPKFIRRRINSRLKSKILEDF